AIRVRNGKAILYENRCVDCGECFKACPVRAIFIDQDDFKRIQSFNYRIALVPAVFFGQFPEEISHNQIYNAILANGFTHIYEVETGVDLLANEVKAYVKSHPESKPLISSFCPAIIRLVQVKFPALTDNIILLKPQLDITALYCRKELADQGINPAEIGVFYITPCAAKIAANKSPVGEEYSMITGVINMDTLYNKVYKYIRNDRSARQPEIPLKPLSRTAQQWTLTHGEANHIPGRSLAIDEIHNVIEFLEKIENDEIGDIDFLELRACDESCAGGVLLSANRFLVAERLRRYTPAVDNTSAPEGGINSYKDYLLKRMKIHSINPRSMMKLDENMEEAMRKMDKSSQMLRCLPLTDCGACGSPNCQAFANDIALGEAEIRQCIFIQKNREQTGELSPDESLELLKGIWGSDKFFSNRK
ncbi:MAG TPA: [Fe-Fe] hydrogenase large subunit C-terminal domain-containing protein, partial [Bacteroidales bacterium]|nr:[Fe-Fe] hydrogenase large subunit C-terminal domain-containing protein [Bacteroidales bacterium]